MRARARIQESIARALEDIGVALSPREVPLEHPAEFKNGDYSSSVALRYAKDMKTSPRELAKELAVAISGAKPEGIAKIEIAGPGFINFHLSDEALASAIEEARTSELWGSVNFNAGKRILIEYTDPNPFKEFHIGHLMSNAIGESISRLLEFSGARVKRANYQGDVGPHVAKAIWGIEKLRLDPHDAAQLGAAYAAGAKAYEEDLGAKAQIDEMNARVYDRSDERINELYAAGREASLAHFEEIYKILGTKFDFYFFESDTAPRGLALVGEHSSAFELSDGAVVFRGEKAGLHTRVFITSKGLPTYETKDLGLAQLKAETWNFDESITVTAHEQADYFRVVLAAMREVLPEVAPRISHITHGMMRFADGKMSSRTGNVVTGESLLRDLTDAAKERAKESRADDHDRLAQDIAVAAIKYQILKQASGKDIVFDRDRALSIEGDSGPYLQYAYARTVSLLEHASQAKKVAHMDDGSIKDADESTFRLLARSIVQFPDVIERSAQEREPHHVTTYLIGLASLFSRWYGTERIIVNGEILPDRVTLIEAVSRTLRNGLSLLAIPMPDKM